MQPAQTRKVIAADMIGNVLEWYDFAIYGYFAAAISFAVILRMPETYRAPLPGTAVTST